MSLAPPPGSATDVSADYIKSIPPVHGNDHIVMPRFIINLKERQRTSHVNTVQRTSAIL